MLGAALKFAALLAASLPLLCAAVTTPTAVGCSNYFLALRSDGTVSAWGSSNFYGQLGDGTTSPHATPAAVSDLSGVVALGCGAAAVHSLAVKGDGSVWAWGDNSSGKLGDGTSTGRLKPVQVLNLGGVVAVATGNHSLALKGNGTLWAWGSNYDGNLGNGSTLSSSTAIEVPGLNGITAIAAGGNHSLALKNDGTVWAWGYNGHGQLGNGTTLQSYSPGLVSGLSGVVAIAAGVHHNLALKSDGSVWAWGRNHTGQLGDGSTSNRSLAVKVPGLSGVSAIGAGIGSSLALRHDSSVWGWGFNGTGQLGDGTTTSPRYAPVQTTGLNGVITLAVGASGSLGLKSDGSVWTWGYAVDGVSYRTSATPVAAPGGSGYFSVGGVAAGTPIGFSVTASGTAAKLSLIGNITIAGADVGKSGVIYLAANVSGSWYLNNGSGWQAYTGGALPAYSSGVLSSRSLDILSDADVSALIGTQVLVGYGLSEADMLQGGKYAVIYTIR